MENSFIVDWLERLNRRERFFLFTEVTDSGYGVSEKFRAALSGTLRLEVPPNTRFWIDYPFDCIYASLQLDDRYPSEEVATEVFRSPDFRLPGSTEPLYVNATPEDVDVLVVFKTEGITHLVMIEAKGVMSWVNKAYASKMHRLSVIFDPEAPWHRAHVVPHFVLASPAPPQKLTHQEWFPAWATDDGVVRWMPLEIPPDKARIVRWDSVQGKPSKSAAEWRLSFE